jgi:hypothetical protein
VVTAYDLAVELVDVVTAVGLVVISVQLVVAVTAVGLVVVIAVVLVAVVTAVELVVVVVLLDQLFVVVVLFAVSVIARGFKPQLGQAKDYKISICCFSTKHATLRSKNKD